MVLPKATDYAISHMVYLILRNTLESSTYEEDLIFWGQTLDDESTEEEIDTIRNSLRTELDEGPYLIEGGREHAIQVIENMFGDHSVFYRLFMDVVAELDKEETLFTFRGVPVTRCTALRIPEDEQDSGRYYYNIRHDDDFSNPVMLEQNVLVNHYGTIETLTPIEELEKDSKNGYAEIFLSDEERENILAYT